MAARNCFRADDRAMAKPPGSSTWCPVNLIGLRREQLESKPITVWDTNWVGTGMGENLQAEADGFRLPTADGVA